MTLDDDTPILPQFLGVHHPADSWKVLNPRPSACSASTSPATGRATSNPYMLVVADSSDGLGIENIRRSPRLGLVSAVRNHT